jgi:hypothetical protein
MGNRLLEKLHADYQDLSDQYDTITNRCADESRDPSETESANLIELRSQMSPLVDRLTELRSDADRRVQAARAMDGLGDGGGGSGPVVHIRSEPSPYRKDAHPDERASWFRDLHAAQFAGDVQARARLDLERAQQLQTRAAATSGGAPGTYPPEWLFSEFAPLAHGARAWADTIRRIEIEDARPINIGVMTAGAVVADQGGENVAPSDGSFTAPLTTLTPATKTGKVDVSRQLLDGSNPAVDGLVFADALMAYSAVIEQMVAAALTAQTGIAGTTAIDFTANPNAQFPDAMISSGILVRTNRFMPPNAYLCSEVDWGHVTKQKDSAGRPLVVTGEHGPFNARGIGQALEFGTVAGEVVGLSVVPSWAGTTGTAYVIKADDALLLESATLTFRYEEVLGPESIRLGVWGYAVATFARYPKGIASVTWTGGPPALLDGVTSTDFGPILVDSDGRPVMSDEEKTYRAAQRNNGNGHEHEQHARSRRGEKEPAS